MTNDPVPEADRCPICCAPGPAFQFSLRSPYPAAAGSIYRVFECRACAHRWCVGDVSPALLTRIYGAGFHDSAQQRADDETAPVHRNAAERAHWLTKAGLRGRLLDIGAGAGYFVRAAAREGFDASGIDLSAEAVSKAASLGIPVAQSDFLRGADPGSTYDVVTLWDVLSGMTDAHACMARIAERMPPGRSCVMTVAAGQSLAARAAGRYWPLMIPPVNLHFFSRASMEHLLRAHGFTLRYWQARGKRVSLRFAAQKLMRSLGLARIEQAVARCVPPRLAPRINLGDIVTVIADRGEPA